MDDEVIEPGKRDGDIDEGAATVVPMTTPAVALADAERTHREIEIVLSPQLVSAVVAALAILGALAAGIWLGLYLTGRSREVQPPASAALSPVSVSVDASVPDSSVSARVETGSVRVGELAPDFTLKNLEGQPVRLSDFRGKGVLINFWATWCPPCRFEMPMLQRIYDKHKPHDFVLLAVDTGERVQGEAMITNAKNYAKAINLSFPIVLDEGDQVANLYSLRAYPTSYFVDREGKVTDIRRGAFINEKDVERYLAKILPEGSLQ